VVSGHKKRGVAYNNQGQRVGRPHVAAWAETEIVLAADLGAGTDDPRATAAGLLRRALAALPERVRAGDRVAARADAGYFAGQVARAAHDEQIFFAIGARAADPAAVTRPRPARRGPRPPAGSPRDALTTGPTAPPRNLEPANRASSPPETRNSTREDQKQR